MIALLLTLDLIAHVISGECGPIGQPCDLLVATTMAQRQASGTYGDTLAEVIEDGYYADAPATETSWSVAWALVTGRVPAVGLLYAYSEQDMVRWGWWEGDVIVTGNGLRLHLSRREPWSR